MNDLGDITYKVNVNPSFYLEKFNESVGRRVHDMRVVLRALESSAYEQLAMMKPPDAVMDLKLLPSATKDGVASRQINICVADIAEDFFAFLDALMAMKCIHKNGGVRIERPLDGRDDILRYIDTYIKKETGRISADQKIKVPDKIGAFTVPDKIKDIANGYNKIRVAVRHHRGVANQEFSISLYRLRPTINGRDIENLPVIAKEGEVVGIKTEIVQRHFKPGDVVALSEDEVHQIVMTLQLIIGPAYVQAVCDEFVEK
ncbi:MAG: hypothetical protein WC802_05385 [Patescibacteria group bacterium]|jgi:hypothetical protein